MAKLATPPSLSVDNLSEEEWVGTFLSIPNESEEVVRFRYDVLQQKMAREQTRRDVWVKPRQVRCSSRIMARNVRRTTTGFGTHCLVITVDDDMLKRFRSRIRHHLEDLERVGLCPAITEDNQDELVFGGMGGSRFIWASAEQSVAGRSFTAHIVHATEVAHWRPGTAGEILGGILPAVPDPPLGQVDLESTPNGAAGPFYDFSMAARWQGSNLEDDFTLHFTAWWEEPKYRVIPSNEQKQTFEPTSEEDKLIQLHGLTIGQILWRRRKIREMAKTKVPFEQEYPEDLLECFLLGGNAFFDGEIMKILSSRASAPIQRLSQLPYKNNPVKLDGWGEGGPGRAAPWVIEGLNVYEPPQTGENYVVWVDPSEGHKNSDNGCIQVLHAKSRRQVACLALKTPPNKLGEMACAVGTFYNRALLAIERNRISATILKALDLEYPNLYYDVDEEDPAREKHKAGWYTNRENRTRMLSDLKEDVENYSITVRDQGTLREMFQFSWEQLKKSGDLQWRAQAQSGAKDDRVIALAGANQLADKVVETRGSERTQPIRIQVGR